MWDLQRICFPIVRVRKTLFVFLERFVLLELRDSVIKKSRYIDINNKKNYNFPKKNVNKKLELPGRIAPTTLPPYRVTRRTNGLRSRHNVYGGVIRTVHASISGHVRSSIVYIIIKNRMEINPSSRFRWSTARCVCVCVCVVSA